MFVIVRKVEILFITDNLFVYYQVEVYDMLYEKRILAYLDVLGFKDAVAKTITEIEGFDNEDRFEIEKINKLLDGDDFILNQIYIYLQRQKSDGKMISQFSDSIVISHLDDENIFDHFFEVYSLCEKALESGFLFRGAIVLGKVIHTEKKLFGPAFIKAYAIEQINAVVPSRR